MKGFKLKEKLKKSLIVTIVTIMISFAMPVKSNADIINDFINLILRIPDGVMHVIDHYIGGSRQFTSEELEFYGGWDNGGRVYNFIVTPYDIFSSGTYEENSGSYYTKLGLLDVNFFADKPITSETLVSSEIFAPIIGNIYKSLRNLAMILMLLVVMYIGIKIMMSSIAAQQAKYKQLLIDWLVGFSLLFMMHYIMSGIVYLNSIVVKMLSNGEGDSYYVGIAELEDDENASTHDTNSTWCDVVFNVSNHFFYDGDTQPNKYTYFKENRLVVRNSVREDGTFSSVGSSNENYIDKDNPTGKIEGRLDLNAVPRGTQDEDGKLLGLFPVSDTALRGGDKGYIGADATKWGDNGVIYLSASIINPGHDNEKYENKAIVRLNTMSYVRTISSFGSEDNDSVILYDNGGKTEVDIAAVMGFSILYVCLVIETIMFTFTYLKRVLQMAFLTMVAPIVAIMYPVDKIGDGKAQAFNTWFKDYLFNILIQPMHLLLYTIFIVAASQLVSRNIIYALAIYGFMIPAEKYFKKLLGFEKASTSGGGPLGGAIGRGLAMDGLGRLAGIGPAARGRGGKGDSGSGKRKIKTSKNSAASGAPAGSGIGGGVLGASGGAPAGAGGSTRAGTRRGSGNSTRGTRPTGPALRTPGAGGAPERSFGGRLLHVGGKKIARAVTGGQYDYLNGHNGSWRAAGRYVGTGLGRMFTRGAGAGIGAGVGLVAGAATTMATGDINNLWKGVAVGAGAGNKLASNVYDRGADFIEGFSDDMRQELANENSDAGKAETRRLRNYEAYQKLDEDIETMGSTDRTNAMETIDQYAQYVDFETIKDVKAMNGIRTEAVDEADAVNLYKEAKGFDVATNRRAYLEKRMRDQLNDPAYEDAIHEIVRKHDEIMEARRDMTLETMETETGTPEQIAEIKKRNEDRARRNRYRSAEYTTAINEYDRALSRSKIVEKAQGTMK